jgi:hypothetical protein
MPPLMRQTAVSLKPDALLARVDALEQLVEAHASRIAWLERAQAGRGPRDQADAALLQVLARVLGGCTFTAQAVLEHARLVSTDLQTALMDADLTSARELGHWLRAMQGVDAEGFVLVRGARRGAGRRWCIRCQAQAPGVLGG